MKKSTRGAIRKAPSAISWVYSLLNLAATSKNFDAGQLIKSWNDDAAKHDKLVGAKHQAVKVILDLPEACRDEILKVVSINGSVVEELASQIPNVTEVLEEKFIQRLEGGDPKLEMDLLTAVETKEEKWVPRDNVCILGILNEIVPDKTNQGNPTAKQAASEADLGDARMHLDEAHWKLLKEELEYDEKCLAVFQQKITNFEIRLAHQRDEWVKKRLDRAKAAACQWWDMKVSCHSWPEKFDGGSALVMMKEVEESLAVWIRTLQLRSAAIIFVANFAAPSTIKSDLQTCILKMMGLMINGSQDARDGRPLAYTGRLVLPNPAVLQNGNEAIPWVFKDSALYRNRRNTVEAKQLPSRSMVAMESLDPTSLPSVDGSYVHGAQKYVQIGGDAAERLLESLVVSLLALGFMQMSQKQNNQAMHYVACFSDPEHNEWFDTYWHEELAMLFQQGNLVVANMDRLTDDPPAEHLEAKPDPPPLKRCVYGKVDGQVVSVEIPNNVHKEWGHHKDFKQFAETFVIRNPPAKQQQQQTGRTKVGQPAKSLLPQKRKATEDVSACILDEVPSGEVLLEVPVLNAKAAKRLATLPSLLVLQDGAVIQNNSGHDVSQQNVNLLLCYV
ncbi:unnamed protein product [Effrenium voratum]|nr:unnamed protein product [Effrenium voratum]